MKKFLGQAAVAAIVLVLLCLLAVGTMAYFSSSVEVRHDSRTVIGDQAIYRAPDGQIRAVVGDGVGIYFGPDGTIEHMTVGADVRHYHRGTQVTLDRTWAYREGMLYAIYMK